MGSIRSRDIKDASERIYERYADKFNDGFEQNKKSLDELKLFSGKKKRNRVAGYIVRVAKNAKRRQ